ncbi:MAG: amino acid adenylation domain-containing protein, partial [Flavisolibacter sp.]
GEVDYGGILLNREEEDFLKYSTSKIYGVLLFEKYLRFDDMDFLAMFSSIGNVIYQVKFGQVGYNAANEFLEHYAYYAQKEKGVHAFTINWCDWLDVGLTVKAQMREQHIEDITRANAAIDHAIHPDEGIQIFYKCLSTHAPVFNVYNGDLMHSLRERKAELVGIKNQKGKKDKLFDSNPEKVDIENALIKIYSEFFGIDDIAMTDDFFEIGGDSLKAMSLVGRLNQKLGVSLSISELYKNPTLQDMLMHVQGKTATHTTKPIPRAPLKQYYPASSEQNRMYFLQMLDEQSILYNETEILWAYGDLDIKKAEEVFYRLIERHESLRTSFIFKEEKLWQSIAREFEFKVESLPYEEQKHDEIIQSFIKPFFLHQVPLLRVAVLEKSPSEHLIVIDSHHIVMDGVSRLVLRDEFNALYRGEELPSLDLQYKDYAEWQLNQEQQELIQSQKKFWAEEFSGDLPVLELPIDFPFPLHRNYQGNFVRWDMDREMTKNLRGLSATQGTTVFTVLLSLFNVLLSKIANEDDVMVGIPVAGRQHVDLHTTIGMFVNTLALRNYPKGQWNFKEFLHDVATRSLAAFENQSYPFEELVNDIRTQRETDANPLFNVMFVYQNYEESIYKMEDLSLKPAPMKHVHSRFDLTLLAVEQDSQLSLRFIFSTQLFKKETVERFIGYFEKIVSSVAEDPGIRLGDINILDEQEQNKLLFEFNDTSVPFDSGKTFFDLFLEQVHKTPDNVAIVYGGIRRTYQQLNDQSMVIARHLSEKLPGNGHTVGLLFETSIEMIACILAVMRSGNIFVPLSTEVPDERNHYILNDSRACLLIIDDKLYQTKRGSFLLDQHKETLIVSESNEMVDTGAEPQKKISPEQLVYIIYTSGTTGRPKGVKVKHSSLVNYVLWNQAYHELSSSDVVLQLISYHFDAFGANTYATLISGGTLVLLPEEQKLDADSLARCISTEQVTHFAVLPGLYGALLDKLISLKEQLHLRFVVLGGEKASKALVKKHELGQVKWTLENEYGPTETTIAATHHRPLEASKLSIIGKPIWNTTMYIIGKANELLPLGVKGEICIGGEGLASGYVHNEKLTSEKFVDSGFLPGKRMYRTGDWGRWLPDGNIEIAGRSDDQVKIRGYRVELNEIESQLMLFDNITHVVVQLHQQEETKYLVAYFISGVAIESESLKQFLMARLPAYMVPSYYIRMQAFPYTLTGKLNKKALPVPHIQFDAYEAPQTKEEVLLTNVWTKVLGIEKISVTDNFFSVGGDSIKSIQISSRLRSIGFEISVKDIFTYQTVKQLALHLKKAVITSDQSVVGGWAPLTPIQRWFFEKYRIDKNHFNQSVVLLFKDGISKDNVQTIFGKIQQHHDALRMVFRNKEQETIQFNKGTELSIELEEYDLEKKDDIWLPLSAVSNKIESGIDLENGPLMKLALIHTNQGSFLVIVIHHLVVDGVSWRILFEDIDLLYQQIISNRKLVLPVKSDSYLSWAVSLEAYLQGKIFASTRPYWQHIVQTKSFPLLRDIPGGANRFSDVSRTSFLLSHHHTTALLKEVHAAFNTSVNDVLLTSLLLCFEKIYGIRRLMIDLEGHGREPIKKGVDVSRTVGWFTSIYPVVLEHTGNNLAFLIKEVKESLHRVPHSGMDYLAMIYQESLIGQGVESREHAAISFNYLGQFDSDLSGKSFTIADQIERYDISPQEIRPYDWDISAIVKGGQLSMQLSYSMQQYKSETIQRILNVYEDCLVEVIEFCRTYGKTELTPSDLTYRDLSIRQLDTLTSTYALEDIYPLSPMQQGMLFHSLLDAGSHHYFQQMSYTVQGKLDVSAVEQSMNDLIARHPVLRSIFLHKGFERPMQIILKERKIDFVFQDVREECTLQNTQEVVTAYRQIDRLKTFDLASDMLMRLMVLHTAEDQFEFIWSHHHVLMDGWCMSIIIKEFSHFYSANKCGEKAELRDRHPYVNYVKWLESRDKEESIHYWTNYLSGYEQLATLPKKEISVTSILTYTLASTHLQVNREQTVALQDVSKKFGITSNTILQTIWGIVLGRYNNVNDVVFGSVVSGRPAEVVGVETMVGLFINTVPVRVRYKGEDRFYELAQRVQNDTVASGNYQYQPLFEVQSLSELGRDLLDHIIVFEDYPLSEEVKQEEDGMVQTDFRITHVEVFEQANYDLMLVVIPGDCLQMRIDYNSQRYEAKKIEQVLAHMQVVMEQVILDCSRTIAQIEVITDQEKHQILYSFNNTGSKEQLAKTFPEVFEAQVLKTPDRLAAVYGQQSLTYNSLNEKANQLAHYLSERVVRNSCIPVLMEPSLDLLICMLGIFKAEMVYVPVHIDLPLARIADNLLDLEAKILITKSIYIKSESDFYERLSDQTDVDHIILFDPCMPSPESMELFHTYRLAAALEKGKWNQVKDGIVLHYKGQLERGSDLQEQVAWLTQTILSETLRDEDHFGVLLSHPVLRVVALLTLKNLNRSFQLFHSIEEMGRGSLDGVSVLITENKFTPVTDNLFWETPSLSTLILLEEYDVNINYKQDAFKKIWNHIAEQTTEALNDYGWTSSYTGQKFSLDEMDEYVENFKAKLSPFLHSQSRVLEIGCGHGILLFELAPKVGYYYATDLADQIIQKNKERLEQKGMTNVSLEAMDASRIAHINEKDF